MKLVRIKAGVYVDPRIVAVERALANVARIVRRGESIGARITRAVARIGTL